MQKYFFVGDKVLYIGYPKAIEGVVTKADPEVFEVQWGDGCISTETQSHHMNVIKAKKDD